MNATPDRRTVGWAVVYGMAAIVLVGFVLTGAAIYQQSRANGHTAERIEDCLDPQGACAQQQVRAREDFGKALDLERHQDLASIVVCARRYPHGDVKTLFFCMQRMELKLP